MPSEIETRLTKMIREFMWGGTAHPTVGMDTLIKLIKQGGKKLLNVKARNEAIDLMRAKRYLNLGSAHPTWAKIADSLIHINLNKKWDLQENEAYKNVFLQTLTANARVSGEGLPQSIKMMLRSVKKHNITISPVQLEPRTRLDMPI